ncbi:phycobilisome protein [[Limnothrix rosea] IAM M-220]|uniref:phycobilisome protein n=1 Tax=[Limnothrix rosea] IAM M-220 TaxID=454133 RepID=UPI00095A5D4D|nr:phycobilisome protein [[Limnothrix rosea] IAM M-220]OKH18086.1 phycobilisome protein [[Limnothrix rosea] IAM M-220]
MLSPKVKELIVKARIVSFDSWPDDFSPEVISRFQGVDDEKYYLTDEDCDAIFKEKPELENNLAIAKLLRDNATDIVSKARENVLAEFPGITDEDGELYPAFRAEACWRDFWQFLRCVTYGVAANRADYISEIGLGFMEALYRELSVPLPAMVCGVKGLKQYSLGYVPAESDVDIAPPFDHLIAGLKGFTRE